MMEQVLIKDIAETIKTGKTPPTKETKYFEGEVNWYTPGDLDKGKNLNQARRTLTQLALTDKKAIIHLKGTITNRLYWRYWENRYFNNEL